MSDRLIELVTVLLLGATTLGTAWCGYQASRWTSTSSDLARQAGAERIEANRLFGVATQAISYDNMMVAQYAQAYADADTRLMAFLRKSLIRPGFLPVLDRWEAEIRLGQSPQNLTEDREYLSSQFAAYQNALAENERTTIASQRAADTADAYVATTILLAAALFFAGVTSSFRYRVPRLLLVLIASLIVVGVAGRLASLAVA